MFSNKFFAIVLAIMLCISFIGCNSNGDMSNSVSQSESINYSEKSAITGQYFAERAAVCGFEVVNSLESDDELKSYYSIYFADIDRAEFLESADRETVEEYFNYMKSSYQVVSDGYKSENIVDVDEGNYKKYSRVLTGSSAGNSIFQFVILVGNTAFSGNATADEIARYEKLIDDINY